MPFPRSVIVLTGGDKISKTLRLIVLKFLQVVSHTNGFHRNQNHIFVVLFFKIKILQKKKNDKTLEICNLSLRYFSNF